MKVKGLEKLGKISRPNWDALGICQNQKGTNPRYPHMFRWPRSKRYCTATFLQVIF